MKRVPRNVVFCIGVRNRAVEYQSFLVPSLITETNLEVELFFIQNLDLEQEVGLEEGKFFLAVVAR